MNILLSRQGQARYVCAVGENRVRIVGQADFRRSGPDWIDFEGGPRIGPGDKLMVTHAAYPNLAVERVVQRAWWGQVFNSLEIDLVQPGHYVAEVLLVPIVERPD